MNSDSSPNSLSGAGLLLYNAPLYLSNAGFMA